MFLSAETIRGLIINGAGIVGKDGALDFKPLIEPVDDDRLTFIEGSAYDLTLAAVERLTCDAIAHIGDRRVVPAAVTVAPIDGWWTLRPGNIYLFQSMETLNLPIDLVATIRPRTTLFRCGIAITCGDVNPNYQGRITVSAEVRNSAPVRIQCGARFVYARFAEFDTARTDPYEGIWGTHGYGTTTNGESVRGY